MLLMITLYSRKALEAGYFKERFLELQGEYKTKSIQLESAVEQTTMLRVRLEEGKIAFRRKAQPLKNSTGGNA